ncbi:nucleotidyltransferase family protein [Microbacterium dauci]|uniref:Nucleotidyltransferase family protein n=1 Tax=Microbacterium dauci TaxID=3048008 RepID=A0ABT6ZCU4_9MICO|nr:nucleotidyltransferase family protein [Microbacterium sp. LX3-4]MDJ1113958.1 nucleotidyltransferase family protein [Microbacterium sp. LX3-4]
MRDARGIRAVNVLGVVLAAGAGTRFGGPKALARGDDGTPWLHRVVAALFDAGCDRVLVALGAESDAARMLVPAGAESLVVDRWSVGLAATMRAVLAHAVATDADAVLIAPVDVPDLPAAVCRRVVAAGSQDPPAALARAVFGGETGHPAIVGRLHWSAVTAQLSGDRGAGGYLTAHGALAVECADLWDGRDIDAPV